MKESLWLGVWQLTLQGFCSLGDSLGVKGRVMLPLPRMCEHTQPLRNLPQPGKSKGGKGCSEGRET